jgi:hypothetical protein
MVYETWYITHIDSISTNILIFTMLDCSSANMLFHDDAKQCVSSCPVNYHPVEEFHGKIFCRKCHQSCSTCNGPLLIDCLPCTGYTFEGKCYISEPSYSYCD